MNMYCGVNKISLGVVIAIICIGCGRIDPPRYQGPTFSGDGKQIFAVHSKPGSAFIYKIPIRRLWGRFPTVSDLPISTSPHIQRGSAVVLSSLRTWTAFARNNPQPSLMGTSLSGRLAHINGSGIRHPDKA